MECPNCGKDTATFMHEDNFTCGDCDAHITIGYLACPECGYTYRTNNGRFIDGATMEECLSELMDAGILTPIAPRADMDLKDLLGNTDDPIKGDGSMSSLIHKCIKCGELAHPVSSDTLKCSSCDFEWEILNGE